MADEFHAPSKGEVRTIMGVGWMAGGFFALVAQSWLYSFLVGALFFCWGVATAWDEHEKGRSGKV